MSYTHITSFQRNELSGMLQVKAKKKDIAKALGKHGSTIYRELKRNPADTKTGYNAKLAKENYTNKRVKANKRFRKIEYSYWIKNYIVRKTKKYWSPEQIAGRIKEKWPDRKERYISKDSIYEFLYSKRKDLVKYLRCQKGKYRRRYGTRIREKERERLKKKRIDASQR
jgi:IS30 family transposase